ncbi:hypothetical protein [Rhizobium sp. WYJ-E13]|uniref:hypothetical protein n=1 Tax=unclassified Rhizobium TaxID=2613769 RepID=UPI001C1F068A|nr:hypothetical protein [Rhizobium sp. WYJ-E13]QWW66813.1 hypothetical protein KQ933_14450 [Rhizobium sp. WYJ-E13]
MGNQHVSIRRHAWSALVTGAALALSVTISSADDGGAQKGGRLRNEVLKPAPHNGQLTPPHLTIDWWLRTEGGASQGDNKESSKQVFVRLEERQ